MEAPSLSPVPDINTNTDHPPTALAYILSFLLVGVAWGFTTPFIRRAAVEYNNKSTSKNEENARDGSEESWVMRKLAGVVQTVVNLLSTPGYSVPLLLNLTGSVWFFLLVGRHELSLTVPITNSMAFLFTVLGEWYVEGKVISRMSLPQAVMHLNPHISLKTTTNKLKDLESGVNEKIEQSKTGLDASIPTDTLAILLWIHQRGPLGIPAGDPGANLHLYLSFNMTNDKLDKFKREVNGKLEELETRIQNKFDTLQESFIKMLENQTQILRRMMDNQKKILNRLDALD
ncbi:hypothetical protein FQN53_009686 [Emmonsiellopsis sp. PD_33]|nr:hypothetical protein FQN53_009686 [Emmonsiellopsis sp. PD_33]